jgi:coenzyme F420-reducing hydrogenase delta subunit
MSEHKSRIVAFLCNWCSYAGADLAGVSRIQYPPSIRIIRVMCSGRVDPVTIIETLLRGVEGVLVAGCHPGDCHYIGGNYQAAKRLEVLEKLLAPTEFRGRVRLEWISASEGARFGEVVSSFVAQVESRGPSPAKADPQARARLQVIRDTMDNPRVRNVLGTFLHLTEKENVYGNQYPSAEMEKVLWDVIRAVQARAAIFNLASERPITVLEAAERTGLPPDVVLRHIAVMKKKNLLAMTEAHGRHPNYTAVSSGRAM